jgi:hypothetical protein
MTKWRTWWPIVYIGLVTGVTFAIFSDWAHDDPFITFRYVDNVRAGLGFVYNPGERVLSTTTPLYTLVLAGLGYIWPDLPYLSNLISALSLAIGGWFLYLLGQGWGEAFAGVVAATLFPFFPLMIRTWGAETCFYIMLILGAFVLHTVEKPCWAMVLAALATLTRADGILVAVVLTVDSLFAHRRISLQPLFVFGLVCAPWYLFSWFYFGSTFPVTLAAKQQQGQMAISESFAQGFLRLLGNYAHGLYWLHGILILFGIGYAFFRARRWFLLFAWGVLYFISYTLLGVTRYYWYYAPLIPVLLVAAGLGVAAIRHMLPSLADRRWGMGFLVVLLLLLLWVQGRGMWSLYHHPDQRARIYTAVGLWLAENSPPNATVGLLEVGIIGYYAGRHIIDFAGLIQPDVAQQLSHETTYQDAAIWAIDTYRPDYLALNPQWFPLIMNQYVAQNCEEVQSFAGGTYGYKGEMVIYECHWTEQLSRSSTVHGLRAVAFGTKARCNAPQLARDWQAKGPESP